MAEIITILALVLANGVFAGAEIAVVAMRRSRIDELVNDGRGDARAVLGLREEPETFLATVQVGITVVSATAAAFGGASIAEHLATFLRRVPLVASHAEGLALGIVIAAVSYLSIVLGELVPKSLALRGAERYALWVAKPLLWLSWLARPLVWLLTTSANLVLKPFGDRTTFTETRHSTDELRQLVEEARVAGTIHPAAGEIVSRALELPDLTAADLMIPRQDVIMVSAGITPEELWRTLIEHRFSRFPVYADSIENVVGYVAVKDVLEAALHRRTVVLADVVRAPFFVPESKRAVELLNDMRAHQVHLAIVVDEHGGLSGIVTMEDVLEELVGEMFSEHVSDRAYSIVKKPDGSAIVSGMAPVREINRALHVDLPEDGSWTTVAGLFLELAGHMPKTGESLRTPSGDVLEVIEASPRRIRAIRVSPAPEGTDSPTGELHS